MDKNCVIKTEHLQKEYRLGVIGTGTLRNDLQSWIAKKRGKEDPNRRIGSKEYTEGERFLKNAASFLYKQTIEDPGISGGRFARYELKLNGQSVNEVEEIDISFIDFGDEYYDGFQYDSDSWADGNFAYNDITNFTSFQESERINNWSTGDHIKMYGTTTDGLMCVVAQLKDIVDFPFIVRGGTSIEYNGDTAKAGFYLIHVGDEPIANSPGAMYYVTFNYYSLVLSVEKVND